jgi:hypothetical protein
VKRITNLTVVVVFACLMIAFCASSVTTFAADGHPADKCLQCGKPADSHGGAVIVETGDKHQIFCCQGCANKHAKGHHDESHHKDEGHQEHGEGHQEHKGHDH